jgi:hypothetical protein
MLHELQTLYRLGYRGHVDFVDDNLIGNKKAVKAFLPELKTWLEQHDYPFEFTTEASLNLADDADLLKLLNEANFIGVFMGIESPDTSTLIAMRKKQNARRDIAQSIHKIYAAGLYVTAGFIVGFDSERGSVADAIIELIEEAAIPVCMVGLLYALPNTQLTRRLASEGRLHADLLLDPAAGMDQCTQGLNFDTLRPRSEILSDYKRVLEKGLRSRRLCQASPGLGEAARRFQPQSSSACQRFQEQAWRAGGCPSGCVEAAGSTRHLQAGDHRVRIEQSAMGADHRPADSPISPSRTILTARHSPNRAATRSAADQSTASARA